ncbi:ABC transporter ATP-binding protein [Sinorhizobium sp. BG8]|uniref:ABC transporter ATP-binding protein n=1 Tax=Sinorhizobium sp. BG8 TaxID=2613773 RepID=UPI00193E130E|nr:ABC transporter ATP-binding protein [Sinorhizobium sp. BG8]QRM57320.1 ABC transporter ATP-binding protein [Sinorhizobium sp. BG8]
MTSRPIVTLKGVAKTYGNFTALDETDLALGEGEFVTLLGPSGCGKTTTLRLIGGFELPDRGTIEIGGEDVTHRAPYRRPVNTVFQDYALFPHMSVSENVGYGLSVKANKVPAGDRSRRVADALAMVGLEKMGDRRPGALSGGQRQRVAMARALVRSPKVLLLDEPLSALDVKLREGMQVELKRLHRELGITFLMVTHDQTEALALSDRIVVMNQGRILQIGSPADLYDEPATPFVADFIGATNLFDATFVGRDGDCDLLRLSDGSEIRRRRRPTCLSFLPGQPIIVGIRPERLQTSAFDTSNKLQARVVETLFQGDRIRMELMSQGNHRPFFADVPRVAYGAAGPSCTDAEAEFHVAPTDVMVFPPERRS